MSNKQQETPGGSMDNVRVKISEKYKPPPRIGLAMSYAQRLTLNKQIQDTIPHYEFVLEKTVIEKMKEWRTARSVMFQQLNERLEKAREEKKRQDEQTDYQLEEEIEVSSPSQCYQQNQSMLMPVKTYSTVLTPVSSGSQTDKSPFNISDFEADTSSPFDNMELKSINDLEELAQVLKGEESKPNYSTPAYPMVGPSNYTYNIPSSTSYVPTSHYSNHNGYYYAPETIQTYPYSYTNQGENKYSCSPQDYKSIPDIMKTLQNELDNTHIDNTRSKSTDVFPKRSDDLTDEFTSLPKNMQDLSKSISSMGFPLSRVARVCKMLGNDQKKVVEHLLAMSELLDLGFPESRVSKALLECDNDRDKALDVLIS
ncbi:uncharacterized protein LOC663430 [Tribolium castaneum]|uniref:UBA domain-containing protein n=1 Tax=Tribolium castaneum TaxID=7070 RepID=D6W9R0_TRICA|nr:PREDICTED: uncharacterized protein LOC663430 [Tribolium castaneum]EEZ98121.1 hypothetical protein TcasGA2_TC000539 [Tribolium castaneum]|eukprot:XP_008201154.1 PREDICTED: uncharacterized protein LOC663430 [Tribolium castaneum]